VTLVRIARLFLLVRVVQEKLFAVFFGHIGYKAKIFWS
jgi:hypothetical protein